jgi:hypothetical protein
MKKVDQLRNRKEVIEHEIETLSTFRKTPELTKFIRQLQGERSHVIQQIERFTTTQAQKQEARMELLRKAQHNRSEKNKRNWRYAKAISVNYDIPIKKVRTELKRRKKGLDSDIQDVIWRNPSP